MCLFNYAGDRCKMFSLIKELPELSIFSPALIVARNSAVATKKIIALSFLRYTVGSGTALNHLKVFCI